VAWASFFCSVMFFCSATKQCYATILSTLSHIIYHPTFTTWTPKLWTLPNLKSNFVSLRVISGYLSFAESVSGPEVASFNGNGLLLAPVVPSLHPHSCVAVEELIDEDGKLFFLKH